MRLGSLVFGFLLAIVVAYLHDSVVAPAAPDGQPQNIVNWEVFGKTVGGAGVWVRDQAGRLSEQFRQHN